MKRNNVAKYREINGKNYYFKSKLEYNYALYLEFLKEKGEILEWDFEPKTFWFDKIKRGCRSYLPDFWILEKNGKEAWHETKGFLDARSKTKLKRIKIYHKIDVVLIMQKDFQAIKKSLGSLIAWE